MLKCTQPSTSQAGQAAPRARRAHAIDYQHAANRPLYPYKHRYALGSTPAGRCARRAWQPSGPGTGVRDQRSRARLLHGRCAHLSEVNLCCGRMPPRPEFEEATDPKSRVAAMVYYLLRPLLGVGGVVLANNI